jgi:hypothetical protein
MGILQRFWRNSAAKTGQIDCGPVPKGRNFGTNPENLRPK